MFLFLFFSFLYFFSNFPSFSINRLLLKLEAEEGTHGNTTPYKSLAKEGEKEGEGRGGFRDRRLALAIEDMFCVLMVLEDLSSPKGTLGEGEEKKRQEKKEESLKELVSMLKVDQPPSQGAAPFSGQFSAFWCDSDKYLMDIVGIRKGQRLLTRCLPHLPLNLGANLIFTLFRNVVLFLDCCESSGEAGLVDAVNRFIVQNFPLQFINHALASFLSSPQGVALPRMARFTFSQTSFLMCLMERASLLQRAQQQQQQQQQQQGGQQQQQQQQQQQVVIPPAVWGEFNKLHHMVGSLMQQH